MAVGASEDRRSTDVDERSMLRVLGPLRAGSDRELGGRRQRLVLAVLAVGAGRIVSVDALAEAVWGDPPPDSARRTLQVYVSNLRRALDPDASIEHRDGGYVLEVGADALDTVVFTALVEEGLELVGSAPDRAAATLEEALRLWRGEPFGELADEPALSAEVARLEGLHLRALEGLIDAELARCRHDAVLVELQRLTGQHPLRERFWGQLLLALYRSGRQSEALDAYARARRLLADELGIDPSPSLQELHARILRHDPSLLAPAGRAAEAPDIVRGYELLEQVRTGRLGTIHRALQPTVGREVALEMVPAVRANTPAFVRSFEVEAQRIAWLEHPHIAPLLDYWREPDAAYLVTRWLRGGNLEQALRRGPWSLEATLELVEQIASALDHAHRHGVVHGRVRPESVLLDEDGNAYLSDFPIGAQEEQPDRWHDIVALARLTAASLLGDEPPPSGSAGGSEAPLSMPDLRRLPAALPGPLVEVLRQATSTDPEQRFESAAQLAKSLRAVATDTPDVSVRQLVVRNPFKGLRAFHEPDAGDFFGRERLVSRLTERLDAAGSGTRFLAVVGPSGSGKSSLVRAGLVPALRRGAVAGSDRWFIATMVPGAWPMAELEGALMEVATCSPDRIEQALRQGDEGLRVAIERALPDDGSELVLVVDQFEELFSLSRTEDRIVFARHLEHAVTEHSSRLRVILTLRADFYDHPLLDPVLGKLVAANTVPVPALSPEELERAVVEPARRVAVEVAPELTARIVNDVSRAPSALAHLQYALTELFDLRTDDRLTLDGYREIGGVDGALAGRAEELYATLDPPAQAACRQILLRLVTVTDGSTITRRRVLRDELLALGDRGAIHPVLEAFGAHRLLTFDRDPYTRAPTVEVAHEALLDAWTRLRGWLDAARHDIAMHRRLETAVDEWELSGGDHGYLLSGTRLTEFDAWAPTSQLALTEGEQEFLDTSRAAEQDQQLLEDRRREREARLERSSMHRLRALAAVSLLAAIAGIALSAFAFQQRGAARVEAARATTAEERANVAARQADARRLSVASRLALDEDPERAILLALEGAYLSRDAGEPVLPETVAALHRAVQTSRLEARLDGGSSSVSVSPDGATIASDAIDPAAGDPSSDVLLWDAATGERTGTLAGPATVVNLRFSPTEPLLAVAYGHRGEPRGETATIIVWDTTSGSPVAQLSGDPHVLPATAIADRPMVWSYDGTQVAAVSWSDGTAGIVTVWDVPSGEVVSSFEPVRNSDGIAFLDGQTLLVAQPDAGRISLHDVATGDHVGNLDTPGFHPATIAADPDARRIVVGSQQSRAIQAWDVDTASLRWSEEHPDGMVEAVSPDGSTVVVVGNDSVVRLFDLEDGTELLTLPGHSGAVWGAAFDSSGERLVSTGGGETRVWDVTPGGPSAVGTISLGEDLPAYLNVSPDGREIAVSTGNGSFLVLDTADGRIVRELAGLMNLFLPAVVSPDWRLVGWLDGEGQARVSELHSGRTIAELPPCTSPSAFSPDSSSVLLDGVWVCTYLVAQPAGVEMRSRVIDLVSGDERIDLGNRATLSAGSVFDPGGASTTESYLAVAADMSMIEIHDVTSGELVTSLVFEGDFPLGSGSDPSGRYLAGGTQHGRVWALDLTEIANGASAEEALVMNTVGHSGGVPDVALTDDGVLATSPISGELRLWDIGRGELLVELEADISEWPAPAFTHDGRYLYYGDVSTFSTYVLRRFPMDTDELIELASSRTTRALTEDECDRYLVPQACG